MPTELDLLESENVGSTVYIVANLIFIAAALMAIKIEKSRLSGVDIQVNPTPAQVTLSGSWVLVLGSVIIFTTAIIRFQQRKENLQAGSETGTLIPNLWFSAGTLLLLLGSLALVIGGQRRVAEEGQIAII